MKTTMREFDNAFEFVNCNQHENTAAFNKRTGKYYFNSPLSDDRDIGDDFDWEDCVSIPRKWDLDLGQSLVFRFVESRMPGEVGRVHGFFRRPGAYSRFKEYLDCVGLLEDWHNFEQEATEKALAEWCKEKGVEIVGEPPLSGQKQVDTDVCQALIDSLNLEPLPLEGGYYHETYRSTVALGDGGRRAGTCIYYLLPAGKLSQWHRVASDEIWLFHSGAPAAQLLLFADGTWEERRLGADIAGGERPQSVIPAGTWQATAPLAGSGHEFSLFSAVVVPGFEFADYEHGEHDELTRRWPAATKRAGELFGGG